MTAIGPRREDYGTHSLRRTKASIIYKATGNLRAVQILLGHTKIESTVRYLGVDVEDAAPKPEPTGVCWVMLLSRVSWRPAWSMERSERLDVRPRRPHSRPRPHHCVREVGSGSAASACATWRSLSGLRVM